MIQDSLIMSKVALSLLVALILSNTECLTVFDRSARSRI